MKKILVLILIPFLCFSQDESKLKSELKSLIKFSTFYTALNGGTSISDVNVYSVAGGLEKEVIKTPFDYSIKFGVRKIAWFGYENKSKAFYDGREKSFADAATMGRKSGFEYLSEFDYKRQQGVNYIDQNHFLRYVANKWIVKMEYLEDGFADVEYIEASQRYRHKFGKKFSLNIGTAQRLSEPYGFDPLADWLLSNGNLHYTDLALQQGFTVEFDGQGGIEYIDPHGHSVATSTEVWEAVIIPEVLNEYVTQERDKLPSQWNYSVVVGFDYYHYTKEIWLHSWGNLMPYHLDVGGEYSYHDFNSQSFRYLDGKQWLDYSGGLVFGYWLNKHLGIFIEGKYNKYWNRNWHAFSAGINYRIF